MVMAPPQVAADPVLGPYEAWMLDAGKFYDLPGLMLEDDTGLSCVAEFATPVDDAQFAAASAVQLGQVGHRVLLPVLFRDDGFQTRFIPFLVVPDHSTPAPIRLLDRSAAEVGALFAANPQNPQGPLGTGGQVRLNFPIRSETLNLGYDPAALGSCSVDPVLRGAAPQVILAIIDLGIPFAHANFRHPGTQGTRIDYCWAQSAPALPGGAVLFGREFTRDAIDTLVAAHDGDEEAIYAQAGLLGRAGGPPLPLGRRHSHGAHVLDTLAGRWEAGTAAQARIIAVDLPASSTWETSGFGKDMFVLSALHYIFERAARIAAAYGVGPLPLVINLSYGTSGGPQDGSGLTERAMAELVDHRNQSAPTAIVMPSGNLFQDRLYARVTDRHFVSGPDGRSASLHWFAPPCDRTSSYLELWYPPGSIPAGVQIELTPPGGPPLPLFAPVTGTAYFTAELQVAGRIVGRVTIDRHSPTGRAPTASRVRATIILAPTEAPAGPDLHQLTGKPHGPAPAGLWTLRLVRPADAVGPVGAIDCRIQRDTSYGQGNTGAQQGYFVDPHNPRYDDTGKLAVVDSGAAMVRRFGTMNGMATFASTLVVGGHVVSTGLAAAYSGAGGYQSLPPGRAVDISGPTERSAFAPGWVAAGTRSGVTWAAQGTSTATPHIGRALATALMADATARDVPGFVALLARHGRAKPVKRPDDSPKGTRRLGAVCLDLPDPDERG